MTLYAGWVPQSESVKVTFNISDGNGAITATVDGMPIISGVQVAMGKTVVFTASPSEGYRFINWANNGTQVENNPYNLILTEDVNVAANFVALLKFDKYAVNKWNNTFML